MKKTNELNMEHETDIVGCLHAVIQQQHTSKLKSKDTTTEMVINKQHNISWLSLLPPRHLCHAMKDTGTIGNRSSAPQQGEGIYTEFN